MQSWFVTYVIPHTVTFIGLHYKDWLCLGLLSLVELSLTCGVYTDCGFILSFAHFRIVWSCMSHYLHQISWNGDFSHWATDDLQSSKFFTLPTNPLSFHLLFILLDNSTVHLDLRPVFPYYLLLLPMLACKCIVYLLELFLAEIPENDYSKYFAPENSLKIPSGYIVCTFSVFPISLNWSVNNPVVWELLPYYCKKFIILVSEFEVWT